MVITGSIPSQGGPRKEWVVFLHFVMASFDGVFMFRPITDEAIFPSYVRWGLKICSGWDNWVGYDFLSANDQTDKFLEQFVARHIPEIRDIRTGT
jgi:hypothetical protein